MQSRKTEKREWTTPALETADMDPATRGGNGMLIEFYNARIPLAAEQIFCESTPGMNPDPTRCDTILIS